LLLNSCAPDWEPAFDDVVDASEFGTIQIAELDEALTFARTGRDGVRRVLAVTRYQQGTVEAVDLGVALGRDVQSPIAIFLEQGYDRLRETVLGAAADARLTVPAADLVMPIDLRDHHIAVGTNFPEHAGEAGVDEGPFLFPKTVRPTGPYSPVSAGDGLFDYEVEVAWVTLEPLSADAAPAHMGVILCNDYTDRDTLLRHVDVWDIESGKGFTTGKSFPGFLPVGNLFIVPQDFRAFVAELELRLYVKGALRQRSAASEMVWDFDRIISDTFARRGVRWEHRDRQVSLLGESDVIADRTLVMSGTPHGTVFAGVGLRYQAKGLFAWLAGGWSDPLPSHVIDAYVEDARAAGAYVQPGDEVVIHVNRAGVIRNSVAP
jgi:2-keto-4-pentenoate hydratase/2-oxohepta-3-ene-1,7-dioic acid hydratase in catechol pathway